jgi:hypothetical protein
MRGNRSVGTALVERALAVGGEDPGLLTNAAHALSLRSEDLNTCIWAGALCAWPADDPRS